MRLRFAFAVISFMALSGIVSHSAAPTCMDTKDPSELLARARQAIGSGALRSFTARGPAAGSSATASPMTWEVAAILPDKFIAVRTSKVTGLAYVDGFNSSAVLRVTRGSQTTFTPRVNELQLQQELLERLLLGWFGRLPTSERVSLQYSGSVTFREQRAVLLATSKAIPGFLQRLWIQGDSCAPLAVGYERERGQYEAVDAKASSPALIRVEEIFLDRRNVSGFRIPSRVQHWVGDRLTTEWKVDHAEINGPVDPALFVAPRR